ncbi:MAG: T9SS type A sorting domain-containing protein [Burkholderiales bacterium]|nr:T9SS type A sorting domain-containing protein [Flavobacterium sp.]
MQHTLYISNAEQIDSVPLRSVLGQEVKVQQVNDVQTMLDLSRLAHGIYFVKVTTGAQVKIVKIIKTKS